MKKTNFTTELNINDSLSHRAGDDRISFTDAPSSAPEPQEPGDQLTRGSRCEDNAYRVSFRQQNCPLSSAPHSVTWPVMPVKPREAGASAGSGLGPRQQS